MKRKMLMAIAVVILVNGSVASASIDKKLSRRNLELQSAKLIAVPSFNKTTAETTISMDISWEEICDLYKEFRTTGKSGFSEKFLNIIESKGGFGDLTKNYKNDNGKIIQSITDSNKDCEEIINKFLQKASKNANDKFEVKLKYRITSINYELDVYPSEVETIELLSVDI